MFARCLRSCLFATCLLGASASCGPEPLPAFANPPPEDAAVAPGTDDADSGSESEVP